MTDVRAAVRKDPWFRNRKIRDGIYRALESQMFGNPRIILLGEGAHMKVHFDAPSLEKAFPDRVLTMPISEDGNTNFAVGLALGGMIPVVNVISSDFLFRTMDAICNTACKVNYVADEPYTIVIQAEFMTGGPTTGQRIEAMFCGVPGLHVAVPSRPEDAEVMMTAALERKGVTIFFEDRMIEDATTPEPGLAKLQGAARRQEGGEVTVVSYGLMARRLEDWLRGDPRVELIDLRWLYPLDEEMVWYSTAKTKRLLVVESDSCSFGVGAEVITGAVQAVRDLKVSRCGGGRQTIPACRELHDSLLPDQEVVRALIKELCE